jgi:ankyrin repeat protein
MSKEDLFEAARQGNSFRCMQLIEEDKIDVNARDPTDKGSTALHHALYEGRYDTAKALLGAKASVHIRNADGKGALFWAAAPRRLRQHQVDICRTLVEEYGADVHAVDNSGRTCLMMTAQDSESVHACTYLLNAGANAGAVNNEGLTALQFAINWENADGVAAIRAWLKDRNAARAFARGTMHARRTHKQTYWTDSKLFDKHLIGEITAFVTPPP